LEGPWEGDLKSFIANQQVELTSFDDELGTIGSGNHFAELQTVEEVFDQKAFDSMGLDTEALYLLIHSGSRALGASILHEHLDRFGNSPILENSREANEYLKKHDQACRWAKSNRFLIGFRFLSCLQSQDEDGQTEELNSKIILDVTHNSVISKEFEMEKKEEIKTEEKKKFVVTPKRGSSN